MNCWILTLVVICAIQSALFGAAAGYWWIAIVGKCQFTNACAFFPFNVQSFSNETHWKECFESAVGFCMFDRSFAVVVGSAATGLFVGFAIGTVALYTRNRCIIALYLLLGGAPALAIGAVLSIVGVLLIRLKAAPVVAGISLTWGILTLCIPVTTLFTCCCCREDVDKREADRHTLQMHLVMAEAAQVPYSQFDRAQKDPISMSSLPDHESAVSVPAK